MKIKVSEATGPALNYLVILALFPRAFEDKPSILRIVAKYPYSTDWSQGGPILTKAHISRIIDHSGLWIAYDGFNYADAKEHMQCDRSELVAGLRCFVASKLGDEVEVPEELT